MKHKSLFHIIVMFFLSFLEQKSDAQQNTLAPICHLEKKQEIPVDFDPKEEAWILPFAKGYRLVGRKEQNITWIDVNDSGLQVSTLPHFWQGPPLEKSADNKQNDKNEASDHQLGEHGSIFSAAEKAFMKEDGTSVLAGMWRFQKDPQNPMGSGLLTFFEPEHPVNPNQQNVQTGPPGQNAFSGFGKIGKVHTIIKKGAASVHINQLAWQTLVQQAEDGDENREAGSQKDKPLGRKSSLSGKEARKGTQQKDVGQNVVTQNPNQVTKNLGEASGLLVSGFYDVPLKELGKPSRLGEKAAQICANKKDGLFAYRMFLQRYLLPKGQLDLTFASEGTTGFFSCDSLRPLGLEVNDKQEIGLLYQTFSATKKKILLAHFSSKGKWWGSKSLAMDTFPSNESTQTRFLLTSNGIYEARLQENEKGLFSISLIRYGWDGKIDSTFGQKPIAVETPGILIPNSQKSGKNTKLSEKEHALAEPKNAQDRQTEKNYAGSSKTPLVPGGMVSLSSRIPFPLQKDASIKKPLFQLVFDSKSKQIYVVLETMIPSAQKTTEYQEELLRGGTFAGAGSASLAPNQDLQGTKTTHSKAQQGLILLCQTETGVPCDLPLSVAEFSASPTEMLKHIFPGPLLAPATEQVSTQSITIVQNQLLVLRSNQFLRYFLPSLYSSSL